jgi:hypothetical protein
MLRSIQNILERCLFFDRRPSSSCSMTTVISRIQMRMQAVELSHIQLRLPSLALCLTRLDTLRPSEQQYGASGWLTS